MPKGKNYENFYENLEEAAFRLSESVVMYDGDPVFIHSLENHKDGIVRLNIIKLPLDIAMSGPSTRKTINSPKFNRFRPFDLGNVNVLINGIIYPHRIQRIPVRTRIQGTTQGNTQIEAIFPEFRHPGINFNILIQNEGFVEMCKGIYPTWQEYLESGIPACALSRDLAVYRVEKTGMTAARYKDEGVGVVFSSGKLGLFPKYKYLREAVEAENIFSSVEADLFD